MSELTKRGALLTLFDDFSDLREAIRMDEPRLTEADVVNPCTDAPCSTWSEHHAPEANWYYTQIANKVVAGRKPKVGDGIPWELDTQTRGTFAVAVLEKPDFLCPGRPAERCYANEEPEPLLCESDFSIACSALGSEAQVDVFDLSRMMVHRAENFRHLEAWTATLEPNGSLRLALGPCIFAF